MSQAGTQAKISGIYDSRAGMQKGGSLLWEGEPLLCI
jgi:hypothetical protein